MLCNKRSRGDEKPVLHNQIKSMCSTQDPAQPNIYIYTYIFFNLNADESSIINLTLNFFLLIFLKFL